MRILVVGSGGREHAIIRKLKESPKVDKIYAAPGNGGIAKDAECINIGAMDKEGIVAFSKENAVDLVFVAPDDPLADGMVDTLQHVVGLIGFSRLHPISVVDKPITQRLYGCHRTLQVEMPDDILPCHTHQLI